MRQFLEAGKVVTTHGVHGDVKVYPYCDSAEMVAGFSLFYLDEDGKTRRKVENARPQKNVAIVKFEGIDSVEEARRLIDKILFFHRADVALEEGVFFADDLLGSNVVDADSGVFLGKLVDVTSNGAQDVYHIKTEKGMRYLPAVAEFVVSKNPEQKRIVVRPIPGMLD